MTLDLRIADRPEALIDALVDRLGVPSSDPFVPDLVVVPNAGMREWAASCLIERSGVLSNVRFVFPAELMRLTLDLPESADDPWRPERLAWHVLALMVEGADLGRPPWEGVPPRPWTVARRVADLLERTASQRPDLVASWLEGTGDAGLGPARGWQAATWRALRARVGEASPAEHVLATVGGATVGRVPTAGALPDRVTVFGLSALSGPGAAVLVEAARASDVLVLATTASVAAVRDALGAEAGEDGLLIAPPRPSEVRQDTHPLLASWGRPALEAAQMLARLPVTPILIDHVRGTDDRAGGSQLAHLQGAVRAARPVVRQTLDRERDGDGSVQVHACHGLVRQLEVLRDALLHAMEADPTLGPRDIAVLCADLESVAPLAVPILGADVGGRRLPVLVTDRAAATAPPVQAALDAALALATSRLERDEVLTFLSLPVVAAALALDADDLAVLERVVDDLDVRWGRDADHRQRWGYPAGVAVGTWRETLDRLLAGLLLDADEGLAGGIAPAAGFGMQDLARIGRLADALAAVSYLTDLADVRTGPRPMAAWAGPLRWIVETLLRPRRTVDAATHGFAGQAAQVRELIDALVADAAAAGTRAPVDAPLDVPRDILLDIREVRAALADRSAGGGSRARLRTGHVSVASLTPLRGVPFRIVAVVGVGDALLSARGADDDEVLALEPRIGERDPASERRAALLDAVLAARDGLIVTCDGSDIRTGRPLELPTIVEELLDALPAASPAAPLVVRHPRHLADRRNLTVGPGSIARVDRTRPWTFAPAALQALRAFEDAADAARRPAAGSGVLTVSSGADHWRTVSLASVLARRTQPPADAPGAPGTSDLVELQLDDVIEALRRPSRVLLRERLGVRLPRELITSPRSIELWVEDPLARWAFGQDLLAHLTAGGSPAGWVATRPASGGLPPGRIGRALLAGFVEEVTALHDAAGRPVTVVSATSPSADRPGTLVSSLPIGLELDVPPRGARSGAVSGAGSSPGGARVRLVGSVTQVDGTVIDVRYSSDHASQVLAAGVGLLAAVAQGAGQGAGQGPGQGPGADGAGADGRVVHGARIVRRAPSKDRDDGPVLRDLTVHGADDAERSVRAREALAELVDLALRVRSGPAPLLPRAAWSIDASTDVRQPPSGQLRSDVERDLSDPAVGVVLGVDALADLADQEDGPLEDGLPDAATPVQRWSLALCGPLQRPFARDPDGAS